MSIIISEKSWHFELIKRYNEYGVGENSNLCTYVRAFFCALAILGTVALACGLIAWCVLDAILWGIASIASHMWLQPEITATIFLGLVSLVLLAILLKGLTWCWEQITDSVKGTAEGPASTLQLATAWWVSFSQKFCVRLEIKE